jgi:hypothetical protein
MIRNLYAIVARGLALASSTITAMLVLWAPASLSALATIDSDLVDALNYVVLTLCAVGWADVVWTDIRGRLILPKLDPHLRHHACVLLYAGLAGACGLRLFAWTDPLSENNLILALYYGLESILIATLAVAIALEPRHHDE